MNKDLPPLQGVCRRSPFTSSTVWSLSMTNYRDSPATPEGARAPGVSTSLTVFPSPVFLHVPAAAFFLPHKTMWPSGRYNPLPVPLWQLRVNGMLPCCLMISIMDFLIADVDALVTLAIRIDRSLLEPQKGAALPVPLFSPPQWSQLPASLCRPQSPCT